MTNTPFDLESFNRQYQINKRQWNRNIEDSRDALLLPEEFKAAQDSVQQIEKQLYEELINSDESWRITNATIRFQHFDDNYLVDVSGKQRFPYATWDSESGQGFAYVNQIYVQEVEEWLKNVGCKDIWHTIEDPNSEMFIFSYIPDPTIFKPLEGGYEIK